MKLRTGRSANFNLLETTSNPATWNFQVHTKNDRIWITKRGKICRPSYLRLARAPPTREDHFLWSGSPSLYRRPRFEPAKVGKHCLCSACQPLPYKLSWWKFTQHNMHRISHLIQQLFVRVIIHVANNPPLLQLVLVKVVPGLKMSANCQDRYHPAHLLH